MHWRLKGCPRCGGDVAIYNDEHGTWIANCLQCGFTRELVPLTPLNYKLEGSMVQSLDRKGVKSK